MIDRLPAQDPGDRSRLLWVGAGASLVFGLIAWATGTLYGGVIAWWAFMIAAALVAFVLPMPLALVSPLFMGLIGWLVDMLPTVILVGWSTVVLRWALMLWSERRWPRCGRWMWLLVGLSLWTIVGVVVVPAVDLRHFMLLVAIQLLISGVMLAVVDTLETLEDRVRVISALTVFVVILSVGVLLEWVGLPVEEMQNDEVSTARRGGLRSGRLYQCSGYDQLRSGQERRRRGTASKGRSTRRTHTWNAPRLDLCAAFCRVRHEHRREIRRICPRLSKTPCVLSTSSCFMTTLAWPP